MLLTGGEGMGDRYIEIIDGDPEGRWPRVDLSDDDATYYREAMNVIRGWLAQDADPTMTYRIAGGNQAGTGKLENARSFDFLGDIA